MINEMTRNTAYFYTSSYQNGNGIQSFRGPTLQRGYGLGGFFKGLARSFAPVLKRGLVHAGKKAVKTGIQVLQDVSSGKSFKKAIKERGKQNINEMVSDIKSEIKQNASTRKRILKKKGSLKNQKKKKKDIFG